MNLKRGIAAARPLPEIVGKIAEAVDTTTDGRCAHTGCSRRIHPGSPSPWFCSQDCQFEWQYLANGAVDSARDGHRGWFPPDDPIWIAHVVDAGVHPGRFLDWVAGHDLYNRTMAMAADPELGQNGAVLRRLVDMFKHDRPSTWRTGTAMPSWLPHVYGGGVEGEADPDRGSGVVRLMRLDTDGRPVPGSTVIAITRDGDVVTSTDPATLEDPEHRIGQLWANPGAPVVVHSRTPDADEEALREELLARVAQALDVPPEILRWENAGDHHWRNSLSRDHSADVEIVDPGPPRRIRDLIRNIVNRLRRSL